MTENELQRILSDIESALAVYSGSKVPLSLSEAVTHNALLMAREDLQSQIRKARYLERSATTGR